MDKHNDPTSPHRRAWDAIPWFVAGSASQADQMLLQQHLPTCSDCRAELQFQQQVHAGLHAATPAAGDPEPALQRLLARIDAPEAVDGAAAPQHSPAANATESRWTRWLVAAVVVQAAGLGAAMVALLGPGRADNSFSTLSQAPTATASPMLLLVPSPTMDFAALRRLLADTHLNVVEAAPDASSLGLSAQDGKLATAQAALPRLRSLPGVQLAEATGHVR